MKQLSPCATLVYCGNSHLGGISSQGEYDSMWHRHVNRFVRSVWRVAAALFFTFLAQSAYGATPVVPKGLCVNTPNGQVCANDAPVVSTTTTTTNTGVIAPRSVVNPRNNFHPGYYILVGYNAGTYEFDKIKNNPDFVGVKKIYIWKNLEPAENVYNFSQIEKDLAYLQSIGKRLWLEVQYTEWYGGASARVPSYMWTDSKYGGTAPYYGAYQNPVGGPWYAVIWNTNVQSRFAALYAALGKRFNGEPYIEGITLGETSMPTGPAYSSTGIENAFKVNALATKRAFPDKTVIQQINYADFDMNTFTVWLAGNGIGIGSPDTLLMPEKGQITKIYPLYLPQHDAVPTAPDVQWDNYERYNSLIGRANTSAELLDGGVKATNPWYFFWDTREPYFTRDAVPAIRNYGPLPAAKAFYNSL